MKLADLLAENHNLILALPRLGIPLGFGEKSVAEVCRENAVPVDFMLMLCNVSTFEGHEPDNTLFANTDMTPLVPYLKAAHGYYLDSYIPHIDKHVHNVADKIGGRVGEMLKKFFDDYRDEVAEHFAYEEREVFPFLDSTGTRAATSKGKRTAASKIRACIGDSHAEIADKMTDFSQIVYKYLPPEMASDEVIELVFDIFRLADDLKKHELVEEKILLPYIESLTK